MNKKIKNYKIFDKRIKETSKKSKEKEPNWNKYYYYKKIINLIWMIKLKTLTKKQRKKKSKIERPNWKTSYTQIRTK